MKKLLAVAFGLALVAGPASASNTGFKLNYDLLAGPDASFSGLNYLSLPYFYFPDGNVGNPTQTAADLCTDLNGAPRVSTPVVNVQRFDPMTDLFQTKSCINAITAFNLEPGIAYAAVLSGTVTPPVTIAVVGSHNDEHAPNKGGTLTVTVRRNTSPGASGLNPISIPYHVMADTGEEVCTMVNGGDPMATDPIVNIQRFNTLTDLFSTKSCLNGLPGFTITPGEGIMFVTATPGDKQIAFDVY